MIDVARNTDGTFARGHAGIGGKPKANFRTILASLPKDQTEFALDNGETVTAEQFALCKQLDLINDGYWPAIQDFINRVCGKPQESVEVSTDDETRSIFADPSARQAVIAELRRLRDSLAGGGGEPAPSAD